jgi:GT2 family glycosyltransferase
MSKATLIVSVYNNIPFLKAVLDSAKLQTEQDFEIIISEDAEHPEVAEFLRNYQYPGTILHLTQPDKGWQKNRALNRAIAKASTNYLIFIDGDCVLHPRFIEFHVKLAQPNLILAGKRIKLDATSSEWLLTHPNGTEKFQSYLLKNFIRLKKRGAKFIEEGFFINPKGILGFIPQLRNMYQLKGCNMSFSKEAILAINGFDETYTKPAVGEDIDLVWRFERAGYKLGSVRNLAIQYHLFHKEGWTDQEENVAKMNQNIANDQYFAVQGLSQHL